MTPHPPVAQRGHVVLLLAAAPGSARRRLIDPEAGTAAMGSVLAEVPPQTRRDPAPPRSSLRRIGHQS
jgi:hypothetical protein